MIENRRPSYKMHAEIILEISIFLPIQIDESQKIFRMIATKYQFQISFCGYFEIFGYQVGICRTTQFGQIRYRELIIEFSNEESKVINNFVIMILPKLKNVISHNSGQIVVQNIYVYSSVVQCT